MCYYLYLKIIDYLGYKNWLRNEKNYIFFRDFVFS